LHKHTDYIASTAFRDEIDKTLILNLYQKVKRFKPSYLKYRKVFSQALKKKLKINKLEPWDNNIDLCHIQVKYTIAQAQDIVLNVLKIFGNEYVNVVKKAFIEK
jgi:oligoendopeptidase F